MQIVERTNLWQRTLAARIEDPNSSEREELRNAFIKMRENVIPFVRSIHHDVLGLTVHDESHLDALWETADLIAGNDFLINPAESFVFGASVLLHDTAMAVAAYPGGLADLKELEIWKDLRSQFSLEDESSILFSVLRHLHAQQAEELINLTFISKVTSERLHILENTRLRDALGFSIGRIAHSHHWDANQLPDRFEPISGGIPGFPPEWTINELKIASLLRCADAAHIDARRAPSMLYAISDISGVSIEHWDFQNRLNSVAVQGDKLVYTSGRPFKVGDASSWWLAYDTIRMIDRELKSCSAILEDSGGQTFSTKGVMGCESPRLMSRHLRVAGWSPVDAEVRVSDPVHLARTLGGRNLYGDQVLAPIRELLQNAVDAVRARRIVEERPPNWGKIRLVLELDLSNHDEAWLHVDDTGVGMSERVMTGPLIDFGSSLWTSSMVREEFPGLQGSGNKPIGKFGIGFFSIFLLGDHVRVASKRHDRGSDKANVLVFDKLVRRPLLRKAATGDLPLDYSTRISVLVPAKLFKTKGLRNIEIYDHPEIRMSLSARIRRLICGIDVDFEYFDRISDDKWTHNWDWANSDPKAFVREVVGDTDPEIDYDDIAKKLEVLRDDEGVIYGRAAYVSRKSRNQYRNPPLLISVGGFTISGELRSSNYNYSRDNFSKLPSRSIGIIVGDTVDASRESAYIDVSAQVIKRWAEGQGASIDDSQYLDHELVEVCQDLMRCGADIATLPFAFLGGRFVPWKVLKDVAQDLLELFIPLKVEKYNDTVNFTSFDELGPEYFSKLIKSNVVLLSNSSQALSFIDKPTVREMREKGSYVLDAEQVEKLSQAQFGLQKVSEHLGNCSAGPSSLRAEIRVANLLDEEGKSGPFSKWVLHMFVEKPALRA